MRIYISCGNPALAGLTAENLRRLLPEDEVVNPADGLDAAANYPAEELTRRALSMLADCAAIVMCGGWRSDPARMAEWEFARDRGLAIHDTESNSLGRIAWALRKGGRRDGD